MVFFQAGESDRALDVLEKMEKNGVQPDAVTYGTLMKACDGEGAFSIMRSLMDEMEQRGAHARACVCAVCRVFVVGPRVVKGQEHVGVGVGVESE